MKYRAEIDGLRALAVLPVILFHAGFEWFSGGFVGVDVFFVISGYLITTIIISEMAEGNFSIVNFYERRARRILPALFFVMAACLPFAWALLTPGDLRDFGQSLVAVSTFSSNILFWIESGYFSTESELKPLLHTWSLAVEEQFYILFPLFLLATWRLGIKPILVLLFLVFILSLGTAHWSAFNSPSAAFFLSHTRVWELLLGAFLAFYLKHNTQLKTQSFHQFISLLGLGMIIYSIVFFNASTPFPSLYALVPTIGTCLLILSAVPKTIVYNFLSLKPIVGMGLISYSAYLWHQPLLAFARHRISGELPSVLLVTLCAASILIAWLSWRYVEKPFRDKAIFPQKKIFVISIIAISIFTSIGYTLSFHQPLIKKYDSEMIRLDNIKKLSIDPPRQCERSLIGSNFDLILNDCLIGDKNTPPSFAIFGDSHAQALVVGFDNYASSNALAGYNFSHASCFPSLNEGSYLPKDSTQDKCDKVRRNILHILESQMMPETIYISARWAITIEKTRFNNLEGGIERGENILGFHTSQTNVVGYSEAIANELEYTLEIFQNFDSQPIIIHQIPEAGWNPVKELQKYRLYNFDQSVPENYLSTSYDLFLTRNMSSNTLIENLASKLEVITYDPSDVFCNLVYKKRQRCITQLNGDPLYYDDDHTSPLGSYLIAEKLFTQ